jgi:hypothetical protein
MKKTWWALRMLIINPPMPNNTAARCSHGEGGVTCAITPTRIRPMEWTC